MSGRQSSARRGAKLPPPSLPAPRVRVMSTEAGQAIEPILAESESLDEFRIRFVGAFGTAEQIIDSTKQEKKKKRLKELEGLK